MPIALIIGLIFGLLAGVFVARASHRRDPVRGGFIAIACHYLAASSAAAAPVSVLGTVITRGLLTAVIVAISLTAAMYAFALLYAIAERPARTHGWTAEDARTSGL